MGRSDTELEFQVAGLAHDVEILVDQWGVPHIYGQTRRDAFVAQGFQAARDRLFQVDLWRRRGLGLVAEALGPAYVKQDRATRLFTFRGDLREEWLSYSTDAQDVVTAFVEGLNAYVDWAMEQPEERLPPEFLALDYRPARWKPEDIVRIRTHGLLYNAEQELARALTVRDLGPDGEELRSVREPAGSLEIPDPGLYDGLTDDVLTVYRQAFLPVDFGALTASEISAPAGSNNWVISAELSATGRPILANDPHRAVTLPSLRYLAHLEAPGLSVIGAGEPHLPGISIGHNGRVGFGLTIWPVDHEDLYVYELHPDDDTRYRYKGGWEAFEVVREQSAVRGADDVTHELVFSRHGPVIWTDTAARKAVALRAAWLQPGMVPYLASLEYQDAASTEEFLTAMRRWGAPAVNMLFASDAGDIGWQAAARVPRRRGWDGSMPVPGDGRFEWDGSAQLEELPRAVNPGSGWFTTSNEHNLPDDHDATALPITTDWYTSGRHERLVQWFNGDGPFDVESSSRMQMNADNLHGRVMLDRLAGISIDNGLSAEWDELQAWDGNEGVDSFPALLFQVWMRRHLRPWLTDASLDRLGVSGAEAAALRGRYLRADTLFSDVRPDLRMLALFDRSNVSDEAGLAAGVSQTLGSALAEIEQLLGSDRSRWTWGTLHQTTLRHPVLSKAKGVPAEWGTLPSVARPGSGDTVGLTGHDATYNAIMGSSFRIVLDVGEWDKSRVMNSPGQSGDPRSDHYGDLLETWAAGDTFPLLFTRSAVEGATTSRIVLRSTKGS